MKEESLLDMYKNCIVTSVIIQYAIDFLLCFYKYMVNSLCSV